MNSDSERERTLGAQLETLRVTLESIGDGVITTDLQGKVTMLNPVAQALTGWTLDQAVSRSLTDVFHIVNQDTRDEVENPALRALSDGLIVGLANHTILIARDGTERNIDDSAAPIKNPQGEVAGAVLVFRDISERYRQERLVEDGRAYAENILGTLRHAFLVLDKDLRIVSANRAFYGRFMAQPSETEGKLVYEVGAGEWNIPRLRELLSDILPKDETVEDFEVEHEFVKIGRRVMSLNARRINRPGDHSELILLVIEDITGRRVAEQAMHDSELRYRRLFQTAKDGILILDAKTGKIIDANTFMTGLTGLEHEEIIGKELHDIGMFDDTEANKEAFRELQRANYLRYENLPLKNRRGDRVEVEFVANVYQEGHRLVAQYNVRDISERVVMQRKIQEQAQALAGESRRKDEFLAMLSHELRNPLAPIRSAVHLLRTQDESLEANLLQRHAHEVIERQVGNLTKMISDLMEVSRVLSGRIRLDLQVVDLNQLLEHAVESTSSLCEVRGHEVKIHLCDGGAWVSGDATRLEEILVNLLSNAAKYTPDGGRIDIWCDRTEGRELARVRVRDNGVGVDTALLPNIFELFTQADRSLARSAGGLGIGLSLAHRLVELHGGSIEVESPPSDASIGSEFTVTFPTVAPPSARPATKGKNEAVDASGLRVLLVDDNIDFVMMLASLLRTRGYSVQSAYTGPEGLNSALMWRPDVVLLDIGLPSLDGYEVARRLRSDAQLGPSGKKMRIIAMTGYGRETDVKLAKEAGFDGHLVKPVNFDELVEVIASSKKHFPS